MLPLVCEEKQMRLNKSVPNMAWPAPKTSGKWASYILSEVKPTLETEQSEALTKSPSSPERLHSSLSFCNEWPFICSCMTNVMELSPFLIKTAKNCTAVRHQIRGDLEFGSYLWNPGKYVNLHIIDMISPELILYLVCYLVPFV